MGRGRGKGKKLTVSTSHEDPGGDGEEVLTAFRRGKPQKPLKEDIDEDDAEKMGGEADIKLSAPNEEVEGPTVVYKKKRKRDSKSEENSVKTENGAGSKSMEQSSSSNSFRRSGSRRKGKPCRAAGVGVVCNIVVMKSRGRRQTDVTISMLSVDGLEDAPGSTSSKDDEQNMQSDTQSRVENVTTTLRHNH